MDTVQILEGLMVFRTTENNPEEIRRGFGYIESLFDKNIFDVRTFEIQGTPSKLISFRGGDALHPKILLQGHLDVVPASDEKEFLLRVAGTRLFGRGVADMKGVVALMIGVMLEAATRSPLPSIALMITGDEESSGDGAAHMVREVGIRPEFVLNGDDAAEEEIMLFYKEKGALWIELRASGRAAHGASPWEGDNAADKLLEAIARIKAWIGPVEPHAWKTTVNLASLYTSNITANIVPQDARALLDIRFTEDIAKTPRELLQKICSLVPEVEVLNRGESNPFFGDPANPWVQAFHRTAKEIIQKDVSLTYEHGATDIRYFGEIGVPGLIFSVVGGNLHGQGEWVDLESLSTLKQILVSFVERCG